MTGVALVNFSYYCGTRVQTPSRLSVSAILSRERPQISQLAREGLEEEGKGRTSHAYAVLYAFSALTTLPRPRYTASLDVSCVATRFLGRRVTSLDATDDKWAQRRLL